MLWEHLSPVDGYAQQYAQTTVPFRHLFNLESRRDTQNGVCLACDPIGSRVLSQGLNAGGRSAARWNLSSRGTADEGREGHGPFRPGGRLLRQAEPEEE